MQHSEAATVTVLYSQNLAGLGTAVPRKETTTVEISTPLTGSNGYTV